MDVIYQKYLIKMINSLSVHKYVQPAREDYIRENFYYDCWLLNNNWSVLPSIGFIGDCPFVISYKDHNKGMKLLMMHPPS